MILLAWLFLAGGTVLGQPDDGTGSPDAEQDAGQVAPDGGDTPLTDQPGGIQEVNESVGDQDGAAGDEEDADDAGPGRFIPSEQISQDLGVSFPADI